MMNTFCAASELKVFLQRPGCPEVLRDCAPILAECFPNTQGGTLGHDMDTLGENNENQLNKSKESKLEDDVHRVLVTLIPGHSKTVREYARFEIKGRKFASSTATYRNSIIYFQPVGGTGLVPGVIRKIFEAGDTPSVFLAVHRHLPVGNDPFEKYPGFGATVSWKATQDQVEIIPATNRVYAANQRPWGKDHVVSRPLIEVRCYSLNIDAVFDENIQQDF